jgi:AhpD family alkylhydroperoxidase
MQPRLNMTALAPAAYKAMLGLEAYLAQSSIEKPLRELVKLRASQVNGCAYCMDMHWKDARAAGETEQRLYGLDAWDESPYYTDRERAALAWTEAVTLVSDGHVADAVYDPVRSHLSDQELADLTICVATINAWNRIVIASRTVPGTYQPPKAK